MSRDDVTGFGERIIHFTKVSLSTSRTVILHLYSFPVSPHLEHWVQFRAPQKEKDIATLEQVQWRAPGLVGTRSHEGWGEVGKLPAFKGAIGDGSSVLSAAAHLEEAQREPDSSQRWAWQSKEWVTQAMMCEICKVVAKAPLTMGLKSRCKKEIRNEQSINTPFSVLCGKWTTMVRIWHVVSSSSVNISYLLFFLSWQCFGKHANLLAIVLMLQNQGLLKATHRHPSSSVSDNSIACW